MIYNEFIIMLYMYLLGQRHEVSQQSQSRAYRRYDGSKNRYKIYFISVYFMAMAGVLLVLHDTFTEAGPSCSLSEVLFFP